MYCGIYVIATRNRMRKIGVSASPIPRLHAIQRHVGSPVVGELWFSVIQAEKTSERSAAFSIESMSHKLLASRKIIGEWFDVTTEEAKQAIESCAEKLNVQLSIEKFPASSALSVDEAVATTKDIRIVKAARALCGMSYDDLRKKTGLANDLAYKIASGAINPSSVYLSDVKKVRSALEEYGITFLENGATYDPVINNEPTFLDRITEFSSVLTPTGGIDRIPTAPE